MDETLHPLTTLELVKRRQVNVVPTGHDFLCQVLVVFLHLHVHDDLSMRWSHSFALVLRHSSARPTPLCFAFGLLLFLERSCPVWPHFLQHKKFFPSPPNTEFFPVKSNGGLFQWLQPLLRTQSETNTTPITMDTPEIKEIVADLSLCFPLSACPFEEKFGFCGFSWFGKPFGFWASGSQSFEAIAWSSPALNMVRQPMVVNPNSKDQTDPLHLHPNESPVLQLVTAQLEGRSNYHPWARAMEMALRSKNKMVLVDGTMTIVTGDRLSVLSARPPEISSRSSPQSHWKLPLGPLRFSPERRHPKTSRPEPPATASRPSPLPPLRFSPASNYLSESPTPQEVSPTNLVLPSEGMNCLDTNEHLPEVFEPADDLIQPQGKPITSGQVEEPTIEPNVGEKRTTPRVISKAISYDNLPQRFKTFAINALSAKEPRNYNEAIKEEFWKKAMETEINVLQANNTWIVADLSPNKEPIGCKSVYKNKRKTYGTIERHKSRLVAKGYTSTDLHIRYPSTRVADARVADSPELSATLLKI
nr:Retrovirus-related Pol polyprotein from transposon TNT 1-94 [Ipomoea batatas]